MARRLIRVSRPWALGVPERIAVRYRTPDGRIRIADNTTGNAVHVGDEIALSGGYRAGPVTNITEPVPQGCQPPRRFFIVGRVMSEAQRLPVAVALSCRLQAFEIELDPAYFQAVIAKSSDVDPVARSCIARAAASIVRWRIDENPHSSNRLFME